MVKNVVILGSSFAGVTTAHRLLKQAKAGDIKITLVGPNTHLFWNLASPRAIVPGQFADDKIFGAIAPGFKQYTADRFEIILGTAESLDLEAKNVTVATGGAQKVLSYDILILATGTSTKGDAPWKLRGTYEATRDALHNFQERVKNANSIIVGGAGATGTETAGELAFEYGTKKKITLISSGPQILAGTPASVQKVATNKLHELKVDIKLNTKISGDAKLPDGRTELTLSDGQKIVTDLYIPAAGLQPNSSYIPHNLLNASGFVVTDEFLHAKGTTDVWAVGDISSVQRPQFVNTEKQSIHVAKNIVLGLQGKSPVAFSAEGAAMLAVPLGRKAGTGHMGSWKLPSFMVYHVKTKTYFSQNLGPTVDGSSV